MSIYFIAEKTNLTTAPELVVPSAPVDRAVIVQEYPEELNIVDLRFSEAGDRFGVEPGIRESLKDFRFVLPAGEELWASASSTGGTPPAACQFMVTSIGR